MNKQTSFEIIYTALMNYINDSAGKGSQQALKIQNAYENLIRIDKLLEHRIEVDKSETRTIRDFLMGGHFGKEYSNFPDSTLYIGTEFEVGGTYENWEFVVKKWDVVEKRLKLIAAHRNLKGVIERAIINLNK